MALNISSVIVMLSVVDSLLSNEYLEAFQKSMKEPNLRSKLFLGTVSVQKTLNISSVIVMLSVVDSLLRNEYLEALSMKEPNLRSKLFLGTVSVQKTGTEIAMILNNTDVSNEYVLKIKHEIKKRFTQFRCYS